MIEAEKFVLNNGLRVLVHRDDSSPLAAINLLYDVGAKDEDPEHTGFAHLFEHLMFEGSAHIPRYDEPLEKVGGTNNAFTNSDFTNYYLVLPAENIETGFWLESDRMMGLEITEKSLDIQRKVVSEEYRQTHLNRPYGDAWLHLLPLAYKSHPYRWPVIGKHISHIEKAGLEEVRSFFSTYYSPANAIMSVVGNVDADHIRKLCDKWFGDIPAGAKAARQLPAEPVQNEKRTTELKREVPADAIYFAWHMCARNSPDYYAADMISDVLGRGKSSRLYTRLLKHKQVFSQIDAYVSGSVDPGLFIISGRLRKGVSLEQAEEAVLKETEELKTSLITEREQEKVMHKIESYLALSRMRILDKAMDLAYFELLGNAASVNHQLNAYKKVTDKVMHRVANEIFDENNLSVLKYRAI